MCKSYATMKLTIDSFSSNTQDILEAFMIEFSPDLKNR